MINRIHPGTILPLGFALILVLMIVVTGYAFNRLNALTAEAERLETVTHEKITLTQDMRELQLLRSQSLARVAIMDDYFERDDERQRFNALVREFIQKRDRLIELLENDKDFELIERLRNRNPVTIQLIEKAMKLAVERDPDIDLQPHLQKAFETFHDNFALISEVVLLLEESRRQWINDWAARNEKAQNTLLGLGVGVLVLGMLIAVTVIRREWDYAALLKLEIGERRESEKRFRDFAEVASDWFWEMDKDLRFSFFSGQIFKVFGLDPNNLIGKTRREVSAEIVDDPKWQAHFEDLDAHRPFTDFQYDFQLSKDETLSISISGKPVFNDNGIFTGYRGCGANITARVIAEQALLEIRDSQGKEIHERTHQLRQEIEERKNIQQELSHAKERAEVANLTKSQFLANMSHELRSPLNAIIGFSDAINSQLFGPLGDPKYDEYILNIRESGQHLLELINDILDLSVVEAGKLELNEDSVDIKKAIETMANMIRTQAADKQLKITFSIDDEIPLLSADERRVKQILINLATNALKFTPKGGEITTTAGTDDDGGVFVSVSDTGIGMNEQEIETALSSFGQVRTSSTQTHEGTGLGLPLAKSLMKAHGGDLEVTSSSGDGTTATIRFPSDLNIS